MNKKDWLSGTMTFTIYSILTITAAFVLTLGFIWYQHVKRRDVEMAEAAVRYEKFARDMLEEFKSKCSRYPTTEEGLEFLMREVTPNVCKAYPGGGFLPLFSYPPRDIHGKDFIYKSDGKTYSLQTDPSP